jgi:hypothetical protein
MHEICKKKLQRKVKETVISVVPEVVSPVEWGTLFQPFHRPPSHSLIRPVPSSGAFVRCLCGLFVLSAGAVFVTSAVPSFLTTAVARQMS